MADDFNPDAFLAGQDQAQSSPIASNNQADTSDFNPDQFLNQATYGTTGQQIAAGVEGAAQGVLGPIAPAIERSVGISGESIRGRAAANPATHALSEGAGFLGSLLVPGLGEASLAGQVGNIGEHAAALLPEATRVIPKIVASGVKAGAEMAALTTSDELSKMITGDPGQTLGSAAINIGLSGVLGGVGGAALGTVSPLWNKTKNILGVDKLLTDFMGETKAIQSAGNPVESATKELQGRIAEAENMWQTMSDTKPEVLQKAMPRATPENLAKIDGQVQDVYNSVSDALKKADQSIKTKSAVPYLSEDLFNFLQDIQKTDATPADKFVALNNLKTTLQGYAKWAATEEGSAKGALGRTLSNIIKPALEDTKVWGAAGDVQRVTNEAISNMIDATKDFKGPITTKTLGNAEVDPAKVQTLINQTNAGKVSRKANVVGNYLDATEKYADAINKVHLDNGLEMPLASRLNPTPVLDHALNTPVTSGVQLARYLNSKGASLVGKTVGEAGSSIIGGGLGALVGHPLLGAWAGEKVLSPMFNTLGKAFAESALDSGAAKGAVDYLGNAIRGQQILDNSISNFFGKGAEIIGKNLVPDQESRDKLQRSLDSFQSPENAANVAGSLGHYLPQHATAAAQTGASAANYLNSLKPTQAVLSPLDSPPPIDKEAQYKYNRALDVAQQPLLALQHVKNGTLLPQDIQALRQIYPNLHDAMIKGITNKLIDHKANGGTLPYAQRVSLNMFIGGAPLDSTMTPESAQAIMSSASPKSQAMAAQTKTGKGHSSQSTLSQINKVNALVATPLQAREFQKRS